MPARRNQPDLRSDPADIAPRWLRLGLATVLGVAAGTMLFATEAQGRWDRRRDGRSEKRPSGADGLRR